MITKSSFDLRIGADVLCRDGQCGKLLKVVVDPEQDQITDLIVEKGFLLKEDRIIPLGKVVSTSPEEIRLSLESEELERFDIYQEFAFEMISPEEGEDFEEGEVVMYSPMVTPYGSVAGPFLPAVRRLVQDGLEEDQQVVERGMPVANREQQLGEVDHVLVDRETGRIEHLVLDPEARDQAVILPFAEVEKIRKDQVLVNIPAGQLDGLPRYRPPEESTVIEKLNNLFGDQAPEFNQLEATLKEGIVKLSGVVPGIGQKRQAESETRSLAGVVDVDNQLDTDTAISARVTAALAEDPDTALADIQVVSDRGTVTLSGRADSEAVRDLAEALAAHQPGVDEVINTIQIEPDRYTANLPAEAEESQGKPEKGQD